MKQYKMTVFDEHGEVKLFRVDQTVLDFLLMFADSRATPDLERVYSLNDVQFVIEEFENKIKPIGEA